MVRTKVSIVQTSNLIVETLPLETSQVLKTCEVLQPVVCEEMNLLM